MSKLIVAFLMFITVSFIFIQLCFAAEKTGTAKEMLVESASLQPTVVQLKVIRSQNNEIIGLLREIRDLLNSIKNELATR